MGLSVTHPTWQRTRPDQDEHTGWAFASPGDAPLSSSTGHGSFPCDGCVPDPCNGARFVRDLYERSNDTAGGPPFMLQAPSGVERPVAAFAHPH